MGESIYFLSVFTLSTAKNIPRFTAIKDGDPD